MISEKNPFENINDGWYHYSSINKDVCFISHKLYNNVFEIHLKCDKGEEYKLPIKKNDIEQFLSKFTPVQESDTREKTEDEIVKETLRGNYEEVKIPVFENNIKEKTNAMEDEVKLESGCTISDLRKELFDTIKMIKAGKLKSSEAKDIATIAQTIINSAKVEIEYRKAFDKKDSIKMLE